MVLRSDLETAFVNPSVPRTCTPSSSHLEYTELVATTNCVVNLFATSQVSDLGGFSSPFTSSPGFVRAIGTSVGDDNGQSKVYGRSDKRVADLTAEAQAHVATTTSIADPRTHASPLCHFQCMGFRFPDRRSELLTEEPAANDPVRQVVGLSDSSIH